MKKLTLLFAAAMLSVSSFAYTGTEKIKTSDDKPTKIAIVKGGESMKLVYMNEDESKVKITLFDAKGKEVITTSVKNKDGFIQPFNFKNMKEGKYTFSVTDNEGTITEEVLYEKSVVTKSSIYNIDGTDKYKVFVLADGAPVQVKIMNEKNDVIHTEKVESSVPFSRIYDLSELKAKGYTFKITTGDHTDYHSAK